LKYTNGKLFAVLGSPVCEGENNIHSAFGVLNTGCVAHRGDSLKSNVRIYIFLTEFNYFLL
jgi:hypothetical protein